MFMFLSLDTDLYPKDVCVSFFHMHNKSPDHELEGNFDGFANLFLQGATMFGSYWNMLKVLDKGLI